MYIIIYFADGGFLELGGQFLHGRTELYRFAQQEGLLKGAPFVVLLCLTPRGSVTVLPVQK